ncbi:MAG: hypothetical protein AB1656_00035 [Candidatus Omnitrophota bacterium]
MKIRLFSVVALLIVGSPMVFGDVYFSDNFNTGGTAGANSRGWEFIQNDKVTEVGSYFVIAPEYATNNSGPDDGPGGNIDSDAPPTVDGTPSDGGFLISDSDSGDGSDDVGSQAEIWAISPKFSTVGAKEVWFHADAEIESNNNGESVVQFAVTADNGATWIPVWHQVEPQRPLQSVNRVGDVTYGAKFPGAYPTLGSASQTLTWNGIHSRWHLQLPPEVVNKPEVRFRIGYYEPADAWWIILDNVLIDDKKPPMGNETVLSEDFTNGIPSTWSNESIKTQKWDTQPIMYDSGGVLEPYKMKNGIPVNIDLLREAEAYNYKIDLMKEVDPAINPNGTLDGRWVLMLAGQGYAMWQENDTDKEEGANLDTPALDMTTATGVFMDFDSEVLVGDASVSYDVYVSVDNGATFSRIFTYTAAIMDFAEAPYFDHHYFEVPSAAGKKGVIFRFAAKGGDPGQMEGFWVVDNVRVTVNRGTSVSEWTLF